MCGELDESLLINREIMTRFLAMASMLGVKPNGANRELPNELEAPENRAVLMQSLFDENLATALDDVIAAGEEYTVDVVASQAIAMARLAGFIAGQLPPEADLYKSVIDAVSEGHSEPRKLAQKMQQQHAHQHGHGHDDGHDHGNEHEHSHSTAADGGHDHSQGHTH